MGLLAKLAWWEGHIWRLLVAMKIRSIMYQFFANFQSTKYDFVTYKEFCEKNGHNLTDLHVKPPPYKKSWNFYNRFSQNIKGFLNLFPLATAQVWLNLFLSIICQFGYITKLKRKARFSHWVAFKSDCSFSS